MLQGWRPCWPAIPTLATMERRCAPPHIPIPAHAQLHGAPNPSHLPKQLVNSGVSWPSRNTLLYMARMLRGMEAQGECVHCPQPEAECASSGMCEFLQSAQPFAAVLTHRQSRSPRAAPRHRQTRRPTQCSAAKGGNESSGVGMLASAVWDIVAQLAAKGTTAAPTEARVQQASMQAQHTRHGVADTRVGLHGSSGTGPQALHKDQPLR